VRVAGCIAAVMALALCMAPAPSRAASDPYCTGSYGGAPPRPGPPLRFGIDPGLAGSAGGVQLPATPDETARDLAAVRALAVPGKELVVRLNRLFYSDGQAGIDAFRRLATLYTRAGLEVELQVRYHPASGQAGDIAAWLAYVRHVVDTFGPDRRVVSMTITNEVNVTFSPNTSDGYYPGAEDALIQGIEAAHDEAVRRGFSQLRFGFTYAYRFSPPGDAAFFSYIGAHGGPAFRRALGFVGLDFYPGTIYPPLMAPGDSYRAELAQAAGVLRRCLMPMAAIAPSTPIWITEDGVSSSPPGGEGPQAATLRELVQAARDYSGTFGITDYRWFNLRDSSSTSPTDVVGPTFSSFGLLRDDYGPKPAFADYRALIARLGAGLRPARSRRPACRRAPGRRRRAPARRRRRSGARRSCGRSAAPTRPSSARPAGR